MRSFILLLILCGFGCESRRIEPRELLPETAIPLVIDPSTPPEKVELMRQWARIYEDAIGYPVFQVLTPLTVPDNLGTTAIHVYFSDTMYPEEEPYQGMYNFGPGYSELILKTHVPGLVIGHELGHVLFGGYVRKTFPDLGGHDPYNHVSVLGDYVGGFIMAEYISYFREYIGLKPRPCQVDYDASLPLPHAEADSECVE
jgi:hypothetical protein